MMLLPEGAVAGSDGGSAYAGAVPSGDEPAVELPVGQGLVADLVRSEHRGKVFGLNQSEDLGYDVKWENVVVAGLVGLLFVSLIRVALGLFR